MLPLLEISNARMLLKRSNVTMLLKISNVTILPFKFNSVTYVTRYLK
ncbi:MAG: hypothetical protein O7D30_12580 [Rickettsia endosymbiont of Ixodes persulcatus]|nr:hypothetical protein [Rickettsia endosymbiont of Ixodes persulcatus]